MAIDLANLPNKTALTLAGTDQIFVNSGGVASDVSVSALTAYVGAAVQPVIDALESELAAPTGSSLVGFNATLNYAVGTIGAVLGDACVSVKMYPWLAKGDGISADLAAIQAACDWVASVGGGTVLAPEGVYLVDGRIKVSSNTHFKGSGFGTRIVSSAYQAFFTGRDDAIDANTPHTNIRLSDFYAESAWRGASPTHGNDSSCVELEFCNDCSVENVYVGKSDDACIRISGYRKGITSFTASFTNPDFGFAKRNLIRNCKVLNGFIGLELVGGAQCDLLNNTVIDSYYHGIRFAGGGWDSSAIGNRVMTCQESAVYFQVVKNLAITGNPLLRSDRAVIKLACNMGEGKDVTITGNYFYGDVTDSSLPSSTSRLIFANNIIEGSLDTRDTLDGKIFGNYVSGDLRMEAPATGEVYDNQCGNLVVDAADLVQSGGAVSYRGNMLISSKLPANPQTQASILGTASAAPTVGTFRAGDIVLKSAATDYAGWICTTAGTPGTWSQFGRINSLYKKVFEGNNNGTNQTRTLLTLTVPNAPHTISVQVNLLLSRAPGSGPGQSRIIKKIITIVRNTGANCVIDTALATGDYEVLTTTAGGATSPAASALTAVIASGAATDPQVINVTALFGTGLTYGSWNIEAMSTSPISSFGL